jgi:hypothetical protein
MILDRVVKVSTFWHGNSATLIATFAFRPPWLIYVLLLAKLLLLACGCKKTSHSLLNIIIINNFSNNIEDVCP